MGGGGWGQGWGRVGSPSLCHPVTLSPHHPIILSPHHPVTSSPRHAVIPPPHRLVTPSLLLPPAAATFPQTPPPPGPSPGVHAGQDPHVLPTSPANPTLLPVTPPSPSSAVVPWSLPQLPPTTAASAPLCPGPRRSETGLGGPLATPWHCHPAQSGAGWSAPATAPALGKAFAPHLLEATSICGGTLSQLHTPPTPCSVSMPRACVAAPKHTLIVNRCPSFQVSALAGCQRCWLSHAQGGDTFGGHPWVLLHPGAALGGLEQHPCHPQCSARQPLGASSAAGAPLPHVLGLRGRATPFLLSCSSREEGHRVCMKQLLPVSPQGCPCPCGAGGLGPAS